MKTGFGPLQALVCLLAVAVTFGACLWTRGLRFKGFILAQGWSLKSRTNLG